MEKLYLSFCANGTYDSMRNASKNLIVCESPYCILIFILFSDNSICSTIKNIKFTLQVLLSSLRFFDCVLLLLS